jgi:hypothetical protein
MATAPDIVNRHREPPRCPADVAVGRSAATLSSDSGRNLIFVFDARGEFLRTIGGAEPSPFRRLLGLADRAGAVSPSTPARGGARLRERRRASGRRAAARAAHARPVDCAAGPAGAVVDNTSNRVLMAGPARPMDSIGRPASRWASSPPHVRRGRCGGQPDCGRRSTRACRSSGLGEFAAFEAGAGPAVSGAAEGSSIRTADLRCRLLAERDPPDFRRPGDLVDEQGATRPRSPNGIALAGIGSTSRSARPGCRSGDRR